MIDESLTFTLELSEPLVREYSVTVGADSLYFQGHFPGSPVLPGVAQMEAMVQHMAEESWSLPGGLRRVKRAKFLSIVRPDTKLLLRLEYDGSHQIAFTIHAEPGPVCSGKLYFGKQVDGA